MNYRRYLEDDFPALYAIEEQCFAPPLRFSRSYMGWLVNHSAAATWIAEDGDRLDGFGIVDWTRVRGQMLGYIQTLEVMPESRRRGVGLELLRRLEDSARDAGCRFIWLHVDEENGAAVHLYESQTYEHKGTEPDYYGPGRSAAVYGKSLT